MLKNDAEDLITAHELIQLLLLKKCRHQHCKVKPCEPSQSLGKRERGREGGREGGKTERVKGREISYICHTIPLSSAVSYLVQPSLLDPDLAEDHSIHHCWTLVHGSIEVMKVTLHCTLLSQESGIVVRSRWEGRI